MITEKVGVFKDFSGRIFSGKMQVIHRLTAFRDKVIHNILWSVGKPGTSFPGDMRVFLHFRVKKCGIVHSVFSGKFCRAGNAQGKGRIVEKRAISAKRGRGPGDRSLPRPVGETGRRSVGNRKECRLRHDYASFPGPLTPLRFARLQAAWLRPKAPPPAAVRLRFFLRFTRWERWGISFPKPLARGHRPRTPSSLRAALSGLAVRRYTRPPAAQGRARGP